MRKVWVALGAVVALLAPTVASTASVATAEAVLAAGPDTGLNSKWNAFGDTSGDWNGGDGTYSTRLPDGQIAWSFSDTFKGQLTQGSLRPPFGTGFVNNSMVVQRADGSLHSYQVGGTGWDARTLVTPQAAGSTGDFLWTGDGFVDDNNATMYRFYMGYRRCGTPRRCTGEITVPSA